MSAPILQVRGLAKTFFLHDQRKQVPSACHVDFHVAAGELVALVGPTGAGKSSVLKCIYRTYLPSAGQLLYRDGAGELVDLARADEHRILALRRREIGFVTQFLHCLPRQPTLEVVAQPLRILGMAAAEAHARAEWLLDALALPRRLWSLPPATFSGGERQRVNLARGMILEPRLLLLDEPIASLDPATAERVIALIEDLKQRGTALIAIFHQPEVTQRLADRVVVLDLPGNGMTEPCENSI